MVDDMDFSGAAGSPYRFLSHVRLWTSDVLRAGIQQAVQIVRFHSVMVNQDQLAYARSGEALRYHAAYAAEADDAHSQCLQATLSLLPPTLDGSSLLSPIDTFRYGPFPYHQAPLFQNPDLPRPQPYFAWRFPFPDPGAPISIGSYGHSDQRLAGRSRSVRNAVLFRPDVRSAHILPSGTRMTVHEHQSLAALYSCSRCPCKITWLEARVAVQIPFAFGRQQDGRNDGRFPLHARTGRPQAKAKIFLIPSTPIVLEKVAARGFVGLGRQHDLVPTRLPHIWVHTFDRCSRYALIPLCRTLSQNAPGGRLNATQSLPAKLLTPWLGPSCVSVIGGLINIQ